MAWTNAKIVIVGGVIVALVTVFTRQYRAQIALQGQNDNLQRELAHIRAENERLAAERSRLARHSELAAPVVVATASNLPVALPQETTNLYARLKDRNIKLTPEQVEHFLSKSGRTAATLLAAFRTSNGHLAFLKEAMEKFPNDPLVAFELVANNATYLNDPADQRKWLDAFEKAAPDNAMANYLSALNYFNSGQIEQGMQDLTAGSSKSLNDYTVNRAENDIEAYLSAGYSVPDAEVLATSQLTLPQLAQVKQLGVDAQQLAKTYNQAGDPGSALAVQQLAYNMGQQYATPSPGEPTISQLVGIAVEKLALSGMDPNAAFGSDGQTVQDMMNQLTQQREGIRQASNQVESLLPSLSDEDWVAYKNRWLMLGEQNAEQWVISKYGQQ